MSENSLSYKEWQLVTQALLDAEGYPKGEENKKQLGYNPHQIRKLLDELMQDHNKELAGSEKQIILNCLAGALHYVTIDIPSLYDISETELKKFEENLEKKWKMRPTYKLKQ